MFSASIKNGFSLTPVLLIALLLFSGISSLTIAKTRQSTGIIVGTVFDHEGAVVVGALVSVGSTSLHKEVATNGEGQYELNLPPGTYQIEVRSPGFCRARRASFRAQPQIKLTFNVTLLVCPTHGEGPMSYDSFVVKSAFATGPDFLIRFGKRTDTDSMIEYEGADRNKLLQLGYTCNGCHQNYINVIVTCDNWTILASRLTLNKRTLRMELSGAVVIHDGVRETKVKHAEVDFALPTPVVNVSQ